MFQAILAALAALPKLVSAVENLIGAINKYQDAKWREELNSISSKLSSTNTPEEKASAAKALSDLISRL